MNGQPIESRNKVVLGIKPDEHAPRLLQLALHLCQMLGHQLRMVHVLEAKLEPSSYYYELFGSFDLADLSEKAWGEELATAQKELWHLVHTMPDLRESEIQVTRSRKPAEGLIQDALANRASLIVIGASHQIPGLIPKGFSVAASLLASSPLPVFAVRNEGYFDFNRSSYKVLIADDLSSACAEALSKGLAFAKRLGKIEVLHAHIIEANVANLMAYLPLSGRQRPLSVKQLPGLWEEVKGKLAEHLYKRSAEARAAAEGVIIHYTVQVFAGHPADEIAAAVRDFKPDIAIFGRPHGGSHHRSFGVGRIPLTAMIAGCEGILMIPPDH